MNILALVLTLVVLAALGLGAAYLLRWTRRETLRFVAEAAILIAMFYLLVVFMGVAR